ncbi:uncharacterized protein K02A2.6-like [Hydractinia symbiolongicarpus]|uniref:uncharacterized protein K02A2.6-like n=1 Tax=Hydractinia symbiolongicarpus TaxID=13093 RepID=UPI0025512285|nr:uncharacterized protein K02A2.6-like [Hydractinia symbiolongicarpus]
MATYGKIGEFDPATELWNNYIERVNQFYIANDIADATKKRAILLSSCGAKAYQLLRGLSNNDPASKSYDQLVQLMKDHLYPTPNSIAERFRFNTRDRQPSETISQYLAVLRRLSEHCEYGETLDDMLRDRLVCGIKEEKIQQKLLSEKDLTLAKALRIACSMESAASYSKSILQHQATGNISESVHALERARDNPGRDCYRCGGTKHTAEACPFKDAECYYCHKKGHTVKKCRQKKRNDEKSRPPRKPINQLESEHEGNVYNETVEQSDMFNLYKLEGSRVEPLFVNVSIKGKTIKMEVDTGASMSVISEKTLRKCIPELTIQPSNLKLKTFTGEIITPLGSAAVNVEHQKQKYTLSLTIVPGESPSLLGRDWLKVIKLDWPSLFQVKHSSNTNLQQILVQHAAVFTESMGLLKDFRVHIHVDSSVAPKFCKARPVPYALKDRIDTELDRLVQDGIYEPVEYSRWAAPIVPVKKEDGTIRICGDYKQTINQAAPCDSYPIPRTEDLFASMSGGEKFTKLDLSHAYQQLELDEETREYLTINTHRGLYRPTRLQYGVHSATGIFQREMDRRLRHIPRTKVRVDDILISGKDDEEHLRNLSSVLQVIESSGLRLKEVKCVFLAEEVTYLGYNITKEGISPSPEKVKAIRNAAPPENVTQLKAYLGMLNYYNRYLPNLSAMIEPLHRLLRKGTTFHWKTEQEKAFTESKALLYKAPLLTHFDPQRSILVSCDASPYGIGAVLAHVMDDGSEKPVCYISRTLSPAERNYAHIEKEGLAIVFAVKKLHQYLYGQSFRIITDHKPLLGLFGQNKPIPPLAAARVQRWALLLSAYSYVLEYKPGVNHANADCLSRLPLQADSSDYSNNESAIHMMDLVQAPLTSADVKLHTSRDPVLSKVLDLISNGWKVNREIELQPYFSRKDQLSIDNQCLLWGSRVIIPSSLRPQLLGQLHQSHPGITRMKSLSRSFVWWPKMDSEIKLTVKNCKTCEIH